MNKMATQIAFLQSELTAEKCREKSVVETNYNHEIRLIDKIERSNVKTITEQSDKNQKRDQLNSEHCE